MKRVIVEWHGPAIIDDGSWMSLEEAKNALTRDCISTGFKIYEDAKRIVLAGGFNDRQKSVCGVVSIPKKCVKSVKKAL